MIKLNFEENIIHSRKVIVLWDSKVTEGKQSHQLTQSIDHYNFRNFVAVILCLPLPEIKKKKT